MSWARSRRQATVRTELLLDIIARMALESSRKLAHYEIIEPIGRGGMGEVYRANDGKLGRDVAIKVLPDSSPETPNGSRASNERRRSSRR